MSVILPCLQESSVKTINSYNRCTHSFSNYLLSAYYVPGIVLGAGDKAVNEAVLLILFMGLMLWLEDPGKQVNAWLYQMVMRRQNTTTEWVGSRDLKEVRHYAETYPSRRTWQSIPCFSPMAVSYCKLISVDFFFSQKSS